MGVSKFRIRSDRLGRVPPEEVLSFWGGKGDAGSGTVAGGEVKGECIRPREPNRGEEGSRDLDILTRARLRSSRPLSDGSSTGRLVRDFGALPVISNLGMSDWAILILRNDSLEPTQRV